MDKNCENDKLQKRKLPFSTYMINMWNYVRINSLMFTIGMNKDNIDEYIDLDEKVLDDTYNDMIHWMEVNKDCHFFDCDVKNNLYCLGESLLERNKNLDKLEKVEKLNIIKRYINSCNEFNTNYLREQMAVRVFGNDYHKFNFQNHCIKITSDEEILGVKEEIFESINYDSEFLSLFFIPQDIFYDEQYAEYLLDNKFYMSLNYYLQLCPRLLNYKRNLDKVKFIMDKSVEKLLNGEVDNIRDEEINLMNVSKKLVNKIGKNSKGFISKFNSF